MNRIESHIKADLSFLDLEFRAVTCYVSCKFCKPFVLGDSVCFLSLCYCLHFSRIDLPVSSLLLRGLGSLSYRVILTSNLVVFCALAVV